MCTLTHIRTHLHIDPYKWGYDEVEALAQVGLVNSANEMNMLRVRERERTCEFAAGGMYVLNFDSFNSETVQRVGGGEKGRVGQAHIAVPAQCTCARRDCKAVAVHKSAYV